MVDKNLGWEEQTMKFSLISWKQKQMKGDAFSQNFYKLHRGNREIYA